MNSLLTPDTYHLPIAVVAGEAKGTTNFRASIINALTRQQFYTGRHWDSGFHPLFRNIVPGFTPRNMKFKEIINSDIVMDALATWAIGRAYADFNGNSTWRNDAHVKGLGMAGARILLEASDTVLPTTELAAELTVPNVCEAFRQYEDSLRQPKDN